jgi:ATP-dependent DNA helicase RecG
MNPAIEKLIKYLRLEADRGYDNRAVVGGLEKMLEPWESEARATGLPEAIIQVVVTRLRDYPTLSPASREETLRGMWSRLRADFPEAVRRPAAVPPSSAPEADRPAFSEPTAIIEPPPAPEPPVAPPTRPEASASREPGLAPDSL